MLHIPTTTRPCPTWCRLDAGHGWESVFHAPDGGELDQRYHVAPVAEIDMPDGDSVSVDIIASETAPAGLPSTTTRASVSIAWPDRPTDLTAASAEELAAELFAAVRLGAATLRSLEG